MNNGLFRGFWRNWCGRWVGLGWRSIASSVVTDSFKNGRTGSGGGVVIAAATVDSPVAISSVGKFVWSGIESTIPFEDGVGVVVVGTCANPEPNGNRPYTSSKRTLSRKRRFRLKLDAVAFGGTFWLVTEAVAVIPLQPSTRVRFLTLAPLQVRNAPTPLQHVSSYSVHPVADPQVHLWSAGSVRVLLTIPKSAPSAPSAYPPAAAAAGRRRRYRGSSQVIDGEDYRVRRV